MPLDSATRAAIGRFREQLEQKYAADEPLGPPLRIDREDESTLSTRFPLAEHLWLELAVRPFLPQLRVGIVTDDRWKSEDLEDAIESSGDEMDEFIEAGFEEAGLTWKAPPVEHYRDQGKYFYFATPLALAAAGQVADAPVFEKVCRMFEGYYEAFATTIRKARAEQASS